MSDLVENHIVGFSMRWLICLDDKFLECQYTDDSTLKSLGGLQSRLTQDPLNLYFSPY